MGLNFPNAPTLNQLYPDPAQAGVPQYKWNGTAWVTAATGGSDAGDIPFTPITGIDADNVQDAIAELQDEKVARAGDTMTGFLTLHADPDAAMKAATKQYVDNATGGGSAASDITLAPITDIDATNVQAAIAELQDEKVAKAGDYMTGDLTITKTSPALKLNAGGGGLANVHGQRGNQDRWTINLCSGTDSGSNGGSDFVMQNYDDSGNVLGTAMAFLRATGLGMVKGDPVAPLGIATKQYVDSRPVALSIPFIGKPPAGGSIFVPIVMPLLFATGLPGSTCYFNTPASAGANIFNLYRISGGSSLNFAAIIPTAGSNTAFTATGSSLTFAAGDVLQIVAPSPQDAALADVGITILTTRA